MAKKTTTAKSNFDKILIDKGEIWKVVVQQAAVYEPKVFLQLKHRLLPVALQTTSHTSTEH